MHHLLTKHQPTRSPLLCSPTNWSSSVPLFTGCFVLGWKTGEKVCCQKHRAKKLWRFCRAINDKDESDKTSADEWGAFESLLALAVSCSAPFQPRFILPPALSIHSMSLLSFSVNAASIAFLPSFICINTHSSFFRRIRSSTQYFSAHSIYENSSFHLSFVNSWKKEEISLFKESFNLFGEGIILLCWFEYGVYNVYSVRRKPGVLLINAVLIRIRWHDVTW